METTSVTRLDPIFSGTFFEDTEIRLTEQLLPPDGPITPVDLTSALMKMQFRHDTKSGTLMKTITQGAGITIIDALDGRFKIDGFILNWPKGRYVSDLLVTTNSKPYIVVEFELPVIQPATVNA